MNPLQNLINQMVAAAAATLTPATQVVFYTALAGVVWVLNKFKRATQFALAAPARIVGGLGWFLVFCTLMLVAGTVFSERWLIYGILVMMIVFSKFLGLIVAILQRLARPVQAMVPQALVNRGVHLTLIDLGVQDALIDTSMCLMMCSAFCLDGPGIGLTPPPIVWVSLATLVLMVITAPSTITIRRRLMVGFTGMFVLLLALFWISPLTKQVIAGFYAFTEFAQRATVNWLNNPMAGTVHPYVVAFGIAWTVFLLASTFVVIRMIYKAIKTTGQVLITTPATPAPAAAAAVHATPTASAVASSHPSTTAGRFSFWHAFAILVFIAFVVGAIFFYNKGAQASVLPPAISAPPPAAYPTPLTYVAAEKTYQEISVTADGGDFQLDARVHWQKLGEQSGLLKVRDGDTFTWEASGTVCEPEPVAWGCSDAGGLNLPHPFVENSLHNPGEFPLGHAYYNELLLKVGAVVKRAGVKGKYTVPAGTGEQWIEMTHNIRVPDLPKAREGVRVVIQK